MPRTRGWLSGHRGQPKSHPGVDLDFGIAVLITGKSFRGRCRGPLGGAPLRELDGHPLSGEALGEGLVGVRRQVIDPSRSET